MDMRIVLFIFRHMNRGLPANETSKTLSATSSSARQTGASSQTAVAFPSMQPTYQAMADASRSVQPIQRLQAPGGAPDNNHHWASNVGGGAKASESCVTTPTIANTPYGGAPSTQVAGQTWVLRSGVGGRWVRFHLVNGLLGGPGNDCRNLVYTRQVTNMSAGWRNFERDAIAADVLRSVFIATEVTYNPARARAIGAHAVEESDFPIRIQARAYEHDGAAWRDIAGTNTADLNNLNELPPLVAGGLVMSTASQGTLGLSLGIPAAIAGRLINALTTPAVGVHGADSFDDTIAIYANENAENALALAVVDLLNTWGAQMPYEAEASIRLGIYTM